MTLLGKIFTVLIFMMSLLFLGFSITVYSTHKNWKEVVLRNDPTNPGLKQQLQQRTEAVQQLRNELKQVKADLAKERAARAAALAVVSSKLTQKVADTEKISAEVTDVTNKNKTLLSQLETAQNEVIKLSEEAKVLRGTIRTVQAERDKQFMEMVKLRDQNHEVQGTLEQVQERSDELALQVSAMRRVLLKKGLSENTNVDGIPPRLDGIVTAVAAGPNTLVEISVGSDDGLDPGHELFVYRDRTYLGKIVIRKTSPNRAVAEVIKNTVRGQMRKGDRVATKLS